MYHVKTKNFDNSCLPFLNKIVNKNRPPDTADTLTLSPLSRHNNPIMSKNFWLKLKKPIFVLAPMANVTDAVFRRLIAKYGRPDAMFTEFVSCDGLQSVGHAKLLIDLQYTEAERPIVAQIFGSKPANFYKTAQLARELGFDGIDINMGCPEKNLVKSGSCAGLIRTPQLAQEIIRATQAGAQGLPVSVKTRIGFNKNEIETWIPALLAVEPAVLTVHGRTRKEMSPVPANWDVIARAVEIRNETKSKTLIFGNGDVRDLEDAAAKAKQYGVDGVMLGRAIFGNPWLFNREKKTPTIEERLHVLVKHTLLYEKILGGKKSFDLMKKHYKAYVSGWDGAKELRIELMTAKTAGEVEKIVVLYLKNNTNK